MSMQTETRTWVRRARPWLLALEIVAWTGFFAFALTFLALRYWVLPEIERYRGDIVAAISGAIDLPVKIGAIETDWRGLRPQISIADVRVFDREGREALVLPAVENVIAWRSLLLLELRLHSFAIDRPKLTVRRDAQGVFYVAGIRMSQEKGDGKLADWLLAQNEIVVRDAEIEWVDELRKAPPLALTALNFRLQNDGDEHAIGLSARPPRELGAGIELRAELIGERIGRPAEWRGRVFAESGYTDLAAWRAWVDYPIDVRRGKGAVRLWATLARGTATRATADVALTGVVTRLGVELPVLAVSSVRGRLQGREIPRGYEFGVHDLALSTAQAPAMSATSFRATVEGDAARNAAGDLAEGWRPQRGSVSANLIELAPLAHLAEFLPFPTDLRKVLAELAPQGNLLDTRFDWVGELPDKATFSAKTRFAGLAMKPWRTIPGFSGLSGSVDASEKKGTLYLASHKAQLDLPKVFPQPQLNLDSLTGEVAWEYESVAAAAVAVRLSNIGFANEDLAGSAYGSYVWTGEGPGVVDLSAQLTRADGRDLAQYLPLGSIMGEATRDWLARAIVAGDASDVRFRLKGDLRDFPYIDPAKGQFLVAAKVANAVVDYVAGWPRIEALQGELIFERDKMEIAGRSGTILGARLSNVRASIPNLLAEHVLLTVDGYAEGPTDEFLKYIRESPVRRMVDGFTDGMRAEGRGRLRLRLDLPLDELAKSRVAGEYQFSGNSMILDPRLPPMERAAGRVAFTESSLTVHDVKGRLFGGEITIGGGSRPDTGVAITASGEATIEATRAVFDHPWRARLQGRSNYNAAFTVSEGRSRLSVESQLRGVSSDLPPPFAKSAAEAMPLKVDVYPGQGRERISIGVGGIAQAEFLRQSQGDAVQAQRVAVAFGPAAAEPMRLPERGGTSLYGSLGAFDLDRWLPLLAGAAGGGPAAFDLRFDILDALGKRMRNVTFRGASEADGWVANLSAAELAGDFSYRGAAGGRLVAHLKHFTMPEDSPGAKPGAATRDLPAVDLVIESFVHRGRKLGRIEVQAQHEGADWRIEKLAMLNPESSLSGRGLWRGGEASRTALDFQLEVSDVGSFLDRMGSPEHVKGGRAKLSGGLNWGGDPVTMDYATLAGELKLEGEDGQFLEIEPGIGKLVSLMSLQMLPRRITLDFRDVFSKGFQWDKIGSDLAIARGVMTLKQFNMAGPAAQVRMGGQIDLGLETQNLKVTVIPSLGDTASTVVGLINPAVGVATMIAQRLLKNPLGEIFAFEYAISGTWTDPKVEKLDPVPITNEALESLDPGRPRREK